MTHFPRRPYPRPRPDPTIFALRPRVYIVILVLVYAALSLTAWTLLCILNTRPIGSTSYQSYKYTYDNFEDFSQQVNKWYQTAKFLSGTVGVLALPLTSSVCASAAVNFAQTRSRGTKSCLTLKQTVTLANKGWTSPFVLLTLPFQHKRLGSSFLYGAIALHVLGGILNPLQQVLLGQEDLNVPRGTSKTKGEVSDIPGLVQRYKSTTTDSGKTTALLRAFLSNPQEVKTRQNFWGDPYNKSSDLFVAAAPSNTNTEGLQQFVPRANSSVLKQELQDAEFPSDCSGDSFFRNITLRRDWEISICMPGNLSSSPFTQTRDRQDFDEVLYIAIRSYNIWTTFMLTCSTTIGYFRLPNIGNANKPGPLLEKDPMKTDEHIPVHRYRPPAEPLDSSKRPGEDPSGKFLLELVPGKGPLALLAVALFGEGSFLDTRLKPTVNITRSSGLECVEYGPMAFSASFGCLNDSPMNGNMHVYFLQTLAKKESFDQGLMLANMAILSDMDNLWKGIPVEIQSVAPITKPAISKLSMIVFSSLLGTYLILLLALSCWASVRIGWTDSLDAYAMLKMGSTLATDPFYSEVIRKTNEKVLDKLPGWVGDQDPEETMGKLAVGGQAPVRWRRRYRKGSDMLL
ncbi:hypothetical protein P170DRAFT_438020 [Aspergillus steynii IBT 23096]|uniref:Uncharacterized protein n=1 Tax=Aspergillus steynii IBT 23096 TaxID=1392250 RepID=A0A2I2G645_9EURO|nr:uncharacterized protein P170DRAFT_438020 [Aspergillus steynii IBT 23096]PLB48356.1 hypothetical protein P170DRAFT_438020 [Aspergillus steynii IBT 23096]